MLFRSGPPPRGLEGLDDLGPPRDRPPIQTVALPAVPSVPTGGAAPPGPRSPPPALRPPLAEGSGGTFSPPERTTTTLTFRR